MFTLRGNNASYYNNHLISENAKVDSHILRISSTENGNKNQVEIILNYFLMC